MHSDRFKSFSDSPSLPAVDLVEIVPDDAADLEEPVIGLIASTPGDLRVTTLGGTSGSVFVAAGQMLPLRVTRVWASGTTATGICGLI